MTTGAETTDLESLFNNWYERNDERIRAMCFDALPEIMGEEQVTAMP